MNKFFRDIHSIETGEEEVPRESVESLRNIHFDGNLGTKVRIVELVDEGRKAEWKKWVIEVMISSPTEPQAALKNPEEKSRSVGDCITNHETRQWREGHKPVLVLSRSETPPEHSSP